VALLEHYLARVSAFDGAINAVVVRDFDAALEKAAAADRRRKNGEALGVLHGLPMTVKESFHVAGLKTTWGSPALVGNMSTGTAEAVARLERAGAIVFGKTNTPLFLRDFQSYNENYGTTRNPHDLSRTPGGSSGGGAAAVAAGLTGAEFGSDLAGSVRVPASFCGVYAHKPTFGLVPTAGHAVKPGHTLPDLSVVGPIARSAEDLALLLGAAAGPMAADARAWTLSLPPAAISSVQGLRIAVIADAALCPVTTEVSSAMDSLLQWLRSGGASVAAVKLPVAEAQHQALFGALLKGVLSARMDEATFAKAVAHAQTFAATDNSAPAIAARDIVQSFRAWAVHNEARGALREEWRRLFASYDFLIVPATPTAAFAIDESEPFEGRMLDIDGRAVPYGAQSFWQGIASTSYLPSTVAPVGLSATGLPLAVQIIGAAYDDLKTIALAGLIEKAYFAYSRPPAFAGTVAA
jgi:amidase